MSLGELALRLRSSSEVALALAGAPGLQELLLAIDGRARLVFVALVNHLAVPPAPRVARGIAASARALVGRGERGQRARRRARRERQGGHVRDGV
jgi:hypothetical protein